MSDDSDLANRWLTRVVEPLHSYKVNIVKKTRECSYSSLRTSYRREYVHRIQKLSFHGRMPLYSNCLSSESCQVYLVDLELLLIVDVAIVILLLTCVWNIS